MATDSTVIRRARVLQRDAVTEEQDILIVDGRIAAPGTDIPAEAAVIDAAGGVLIPGLIDAHVHLDGPDALAQLAQWGVTTVLDMGERAPQDLHGSTGNALPAVLGAGLPATAPGGMHTHKMGFPAASEIVSPDDATRFVRDRIEGGSDFIKIIVEDPKVPGTKALPPAILAALVREGHAAGKLVIAHVVTGAALDLADDAGVDVITHTPLDAQPSSQRMAHLAERQVVLVPTLTMMGEAATSITSKLMFRVLMAVHIAPRLDYTHAQQLVRTFHDRGLTVLAGTDANTEPLVPARPVFGSSLHDELALLVAAGLSPAEALWAATGATATVFGLEDRGVVEVGRRADLVLVGTDPTRDIAATRDIRGVWIGGERAR